LVEDREGDLQRLVAQVGVERVELVRRAQRLVGDSAKRERRDVRATDALCPTTGAIRARLGFVRAEPEGANQDELLDPRLRGERGLAERVSVDRNLPPAREPDPLGLTRRLDACARGVVSQEDHREPAPRSGYEHRGDRQQHARAVPGLPVGGNRAAVTHPPQPLERCVEDSTRRPRMQVRDEADAAGVELGSVGRVDQGRRPSAECLERSFPPDADDLAGGAGAERRLARKDARKDVGNRQRLRAASHGSRSPYSTGQTAPTRRSRT
jgi:hypothetical protein